MKEYDEAFGETEHLANEPYAIKVKYHEGASRIGSDIHGVMCDLAASETVELKHGEVKIIPLGVSMKLPYGEFGIVVPRSSTCLKHGIMMANSVGIIEPDYCGDGDVWGFVAYAIRDTVIERGTRIAQFMPAPFIPDWNTIIFKEIESMGCADRGGYGSTGDRSAEGQTAEGRTFRDANGLEMHVGNYVTDEFGECFCVMGLNEEDGATAAYADLGNRRTSLEVAPCLSLKLDERPHDFDGVPIEVGDVLYEVDGNGEHLTSYSRTALHAGAGSVVGVKTPIGPEFFMDSMRLTHREPDSFEKIAADSSMSSLTYCKKRGLGLDLDISNMRDDLISRMKAVAARGWQR